MVIEIYRNQGGGGGGGGYLKFDHIGSDHTGFDYFYDFLMSFTIIFIIFMI